MVPCEGRFLSKGLSCLMMGSASPDNASTMMHGSCNDSETRLRVDAKQLEPALRRGGTRLWW